jgi:predicted DNA-binding transcriptional regulator AlpA
MPSRTAKKNSILSLIEAAELIGMSRSIVHQKCVEGTMPGAMRIGNRWCCNRDVLLLAMSPREAVLSVHEVAELTGMSEQVVRRHCRQETLPGSIRVGGQWACRRKELLDAIKRSALPRVKKRKSGSAPRTPPYGFKREGRGLREDPFEQRVLAEMREWREQGWTAERIAAELNSCNVPTPKRGRTWYPTTIRALLLKNRTIPHQG